MPSLTMNNLPVTFAHTVKYLGLIFDRTLSWIPHIKQLKASCLRSLNLLKMASNTNWGADRTSMLTLYRTLVRSKLDYGCNAYNSSSGTTLKMLDSVQNAGLRIATGAFRSSPINSLYVDAGEPPLDLQQLDLIYFVKIISAINHPINELFPNRQTLNQQQIDLTKRTPFTVKVSTLLLSLNIEIPTLQETSAIRNGMSVFFAWVPGHCGIAGNELADRAAKVAITEGIPYREVPVSDFIALIKHKIKLKWR
ncbi:uncharacterized protein [Halyomorpha halys]|uniref:uncharacterized protein n=1 Tax=Halyomorpha halys TaxID=286706 RepID=UPI0034D337C2